mmetsp:Transcript_126643/g.370023  ORF Transcript_126643/g.370023 Transcript_126643/m.370023 type:complete len:247 (-) Transcript_126643:202-942(-)
MLLLLHSAETPLAVGCHVTAQGHARGDEAWVVDDHSGFWQPLTQFAPHADVGQLAVEVCHMRPQPEALPRNPVRGHQMPPVSRPHAAASEEDDPYIWGQDGHEKRCEQEVAKVVDSHRTVLAVLADKVAGVVCQEPLLLIQPLLVVARRATVVQPRVEQQHVHLREDRAHVRRHAVDLLVVVQLRNRGRRVARVRLGLVQLLHCTPRPLLTRTVENEIGAHTAHEDRCGVADPGRCASDQHIRGRK